METSFCVTTSNKTANLEFRGGQSLSAAWNLKDQMNKSFIDRVSYGTLDAAANYRTSKAGTVLNGATIGTTIGRKGDKGLFGAGKKVEGSTFFRGLGELRLDRQKRIRFSPLCCALLLGIFPLIATATNDTIINSSSIESIVNNGSLTSITNEASGTIVGNVSNFSGGFTLSNSGTIGGYVSNSSANDIHVINYSTGSIIGGARNYQSGTLNVTNYGRIGKIGSNGSKDFLISQKGVVVLTNHAGGVVEGVLRSLVTGVLNVTNQGTFTQSVALQSSESSTIRNSSGGVIMGVIWNLSGAGSQSIDNAGIIRYNVKNMSSSIVDFTNSGTIISGAMNSGSGAINVTNSGVIGVSSRNTTNVFIAESGRATLANSGTVYGNLNAQGGSVYLTSNTGTITGSVLNNGRGTISVNNSANGLIQGIVGNGASGSNNNGIATVNNEGTILGGLSTSSGTLNVTNQGVIGVSTSPSRGIFIAEAMARATLVNTGTIYGGFRASSGSTISLNQNSGTIVGSIANNSSGLISIANNAGGLIEGTISNNDVGSTTIYNAGLVSGTVSNTTNARGRLSLNNTGNITGNINNGGTATLSNSGTISGTIANIGSGTLNVSSTGGVIANISNSGRRFDLNSTGGTIANIANTGAAAFITNAGGVITNINNADTGTLNVNSNSGTISSIANSGSLISISNQASGTINFMDNQSGTAILNNQGTMGNIRNAGMLSSFTNSGAILGSLDNQAGGIISSNINNTNSTFIKGGIKNAGTMTGTIINSSNSFSVANSGSLRELSNTNGILSFVNTGGLVTQISNSGSGGLNLNSSGGTITSIINSGTSATITSSGTSAIGSIDNQNGTIQLTQDGGDIDSVNNNSGASLNVNSRGGAIASIRNAGVLATITNSAAGNIGNISNTGVVHINSSGGTIASIINSGTSATITSSGTGTIGSINNRSGTVILNNNTGGTINSISNLIGATLTFGSTNAGIIGYIDNQGTMSSLSNSGFIAFLNNQGEISGNIDNVSNAIATISNEGSVEGQITASGSAKVTIFNDGVISGGIKASDSSSINVIGEDESMIGPVHNTGSGLITLSGLTVLAKTPTISSRNLTKSYDITNDGGGSILVENLLVDLEPYTDSYIEKGNFSDAYADRISLGGSNLNAIDINNITVDLAQSIPLDAFLAQTVNISQFINGAFGDGNREAHDCSSTGNANCRFETTEDGDIKKAYFGGTLINGLRDNIGDENFIKIRGVHSFDVVLADQHGNFNVVPKPEDSGAAQLDKAIFSFARERSDFINNVATSSIAGLNYYLKHSTNYRRYGREGLFHDAKNEFYASLTSDLVSQDAFGKGFLSSKNSTVYVLPYFSSQSIRLDNGSTAKGHTRGFIAGYTGFALDDTFYSIYGGYEDMDMNTGDYGLNSRSLYAGFKISDFLINLGDNTELFAQYDGSIVGAKKSIKDNDEQSGIKANPNSYMWSLGADLGVNYFVGRNIFTSQLGFGYDGSVIDAYKLDVPFEKTKFNTYHTRVELAWARDWAAHLQTVVEGGLRYYFNSDVEFNYELAGDRIKGDARLSQWHEFVGVHFVVPVNQAFYFKLSYNGAFSKDGKSHTGFARFNYLF